MSRSADGDHAQSSSGSKSGANSTNQTNQEAAVNVICDELVDDVILGMCFEVHRSVKMGTFFLDEMDETSEKDYEIVDEIGLDVFGQVPMKKQLECICPNCQRNLAASRFAPHLEKCMGMGRSSSRIANRRIANSGKDAGSDDDENDDDWTYNTDRKGAKKKREKSIHSPRRTKLSKVKNGEIPNAAAGSTDVGGTLTNHETISAVSTSSKKKDKKVKAGVNTTTPAGAITSTSTATAATVAATTSTARAKKVAPSSGGNTKNKSLTGPSSASSSSTSGANHAGQYEVT